MKDHRIKLALITGLLAIAIGTAAAAAAAAPDTTAPVPASDEDCPAGTRMLPHRECMP